MIKGIGIDIIELDRIRNLMNNNRFIERILTVKEKQTFALLQSESRKVEFIAGRFAAKEAFSKAMGTGIGELSFQDIEVLNNEKGAPFITYLKEEHMNIFISITHSREYAAAQVVIEV